MGTQQTQIHKHCIENPQMLHSEASRETKPLDGCLETGSSKALNVFFSIPSNSFNLQHLVFAFALDAGEYAERNEQQLSRLESEQSGCCARQQRCSVLLYAARNKHTSKKT